MVGACRNNIRVLAREVSGLTNLTHLDLNDNWIKVLPRGYTRLVKLRVRAAAVVISRITGRRRSLTITH